MSRSAVKAGEAYVEVGLRSKIQSGAQAISRELRDIGSSMKSVGSSLQGAAFSVGAPLVAGLVGVGTVYANFSQRMSEVRAVTGATDQQFALLNQRAKDLGASTKFSASEVAEGMKFLGMAGFKTSDILAGIGPMLSLAAAGGLELQTAADIASNVGTAFGLSANQLGRVADVLATTATNSNTSVEQMGEAFAYAGAVAKSAGASVEDVAAAIGILGNAGVQASSAGTSVRGLFASLVANRGHLSKLGVEVADSSGRMRSIVDVMQDLSGAFAGMSEAERVQRSINLFGRIHAKAALILTENIGPFKQMRAMYDTNANSAAKMAAVMTNNVMGAFVAAKSAAEGFLIALGEGFDGMMRGVLNASTSALRFATKFLDANQGIAQGLGYLALGGIIAAGVVFALGTALVMLGSVVSAVATIFASISFILSLPFLPVIAVLGAVGVALVSLLGIMAFAISQSSNFQGMWVQITQSLRWVLLGFQQMMGGIGNAMAAGNIGLAAQILFAGLMVIFHRGLNALKIFFLHGLASMMEGAVKLLGNLPSLIRKAWSGGIGSISNELLATVMSPFDSSAAEANFNRLLQQAAFEKKQSDINAKRKQLAEGRLAGPGQTQQQRFQTLSKFNEQRQRLIQSQVVARKQAQAQFAARQAAIQQQISQVPGRVGPNAAGGQISRAVAGNENLEKLNQQQLLQLQQLNKRRPVVLQEGKL